MPRKKPQPKPKADDSDVDSWPNPFGPLPPPTGLSGLRKQLEKTETAAKNYQSTIESERKAFEAKTTNERRLLELRQEEIKGLRAQIEQARNEVLLAFFSTEGAIDALAPEHGRTSCSDTNTINENRGCARCALLIAKDRGYIDFTWEFQVNPPQ